MNNPWNQHEHGANPYRNRHQLFSSGCCVHVRDRCHTCKEKARKWRKKKNNRERERKRRQKITERERQNATKTRERNRRQGWVGSRETDIT